MSRLLQLIALTTLMSSCGKKEAPKPPSPVVQTRPIIQKTVPIWVETVGNVLANLNVSVTPQVGGQVESVFVKEGQHVKAGDLLYIIDPRPYEAQLAQAQGTLMQDKANLQFQKQRLERYSKLVPEDYVSKINIEEYESGVLQAQGLVEKDEGVVAQAKINLDWAYIRSPIDGKISKYNIDIGNVVAPGDASALTIIRQISPIQVQFTYTQREFEEIQLQFGTAKPFEFEVTLLQEKIDPIKGQVYFFDNTINTSTGTILMKGRIENLDERLWPGEFVRVGMLLKMQDNAVLIPLEAIEKGQQGFSTFVVNQDNIAELRHVEIGRQVDQSYLVKSGVKAGENVISVGQLNVRDGMQVRVNNQEDPNAEKKEMWQLRR